MKAIDVNEIEKTIEVRYGEDIKIYIDDFFMSNYLKVNPENAFRFILNEVNPYLVKWTKKNNTHSPNLREHKGYVLAPIDYKEVRRVVLAVMRFKGIPTRRKMSASIREERDERNQHVRKHQQRYNNWAKNRKRYKGKVSIAALVDWIDDSESDSGIDFFKEWVSGWVAQ